MNNIMNESKHLRVIRTLSLLILIGFLFALAAGLSYGAVEAHKPIRVKILYDFSGSMYPGYPETPRHVSGVGYFHQYPAFREWLARFVGQQERFNAKTVSISTFRSLQYFEPGDIVEIQPPMPVPQSADGLALLFSRLDRPRGIDYTFLRQSLAYAVRNRFEGLVWLITDNRVESGSGGQTTRDFLKSLKQHTNYRSVHIYKYPFQDPESGKQSALAVYGILVSPDPVDPAVASAFDARFHSLKKIFPGRNHLKLKNLEVDPISLDIRSATGMETGTTEKQIRTEGQLKGIPFSVSIVSKLTQHTITGGTIRIQLDGQLTPKDAEKAKKYGIKPIPATYFQPARLILTGQIPPAGTSNLGRFHMVSRKSVDIPISGFMNQLEAALHPFSIEFTGRGIISSDNLQLEIKTEGMKAVRDIYGGADMASIFLPEDTKTVIQANPATFDVGFTLKSAASRGIYLLVACLIPLIPLTLIILLFTRKETYKYRINEKERTIALRRFGSHDIKVENHFIGTIKRGLGRTLGFHGNTETRNLIIKPTGKRDELHVTLPDTSSFYITIDSLRPPAETGRSSQQHPAPPPSNIGTSAGGPRVKIKPPRR